MDQLEMRPACTMSGSDLLTALDALHTEAALRDTYRFHLLARLDEIGHAKDLGARDTTELLSIRHRLNPTDIRRDLRLARALPKYETVTTALPDPNAPTDLDDPDNLDDLDDTAADPNATASDSADPDTETPAPVRLHPGQAQAIVSAFEKVPTTVGHHTAIHHGHYTVTITNGTVHITRPTWANKAQPPGVRLSRRYRPGPPSAGRAAGALACGAELGAEGRALSTLTGIDSSAGRRRRRQGGLHLSAEKTSDRLSVGATAWRSLLCWPVHSGCNGVGTLRRREAGRCLQQRRRRPVSSRTVSCLRHQDG